MTTDILETWIPSADGTKDLVTIDLDAVWSAEFARWDARVATEVAEAIASEVIRILREVSRG